MCEVLEIGGRAVTDIQYGNDFTVILTEDGFAWTADLNLYGQLSRDTTDRALFTKVQGLPGVQQIATGLVHNVVLTNDRRLFSWGCGLEGRLGYNAGEMNPIPRRISGVTSPTFVCCSSLACMSLAGNSEVLTWGNPLYIGRSGYARPPAPVIGIPLEQTIIKVSCGAFHMVALSSSGRLYGWGSGNNGEILQVDEFQPHVTELDLGEEVVRDVVAGPFITIITTYTEDAYYFGYYKGGSYKIPNLANSTHTPRDLMARSLSGQRTYGAVKLGCKANYV